MKTSANHPQSQAKYYFAQTDIDGKSRGWVLAQGPSKQPREVQKVLPDQATIERRSGKTF
jgi:hypothetical protein